MKFPWSMPGRSRREASAPAAQPRGEERAYLLLEEARLRCLRLRQDERPEGLGPAYREIGMAGYMASARIPSDRRLGLLSEARERCGAGPADLSDGLAALDAIVTSAIGAVDGALVAPGFTDHLQTASEHLASARATLGELLGAEPAAAAPAART